MFLFVLRMLLPPEGFIPHMYHLLLSSGTRLVLKPSILIVYKPKWMIFLCMTGLALLITTCSNWMKPCPTRLSQLAVCPGGCLSPNLIGVQNSASSVIANDFGGKIWVENGRPWHGAVFDCYKGVKKLFRKVCRRKITNINDNELHNINECFKARKMSSFWNQIKNRRQNQRINWSLDAHQLAEYYRGTMGSDNTPLTPCQCQINNVVRDTFHEWVGSPQYTVLTDRQINCAICALRKNVSAGIDGISAEYFIYGNSEILRSHLLAIHNSMFNLTTVPSVLLTGNIIPILKKSTLDPNIVNNFRPITLGSTNGKLIEFFDIACWHGTP